VPRELEYLAEALEEAEAAARWYAERSAASAAAFSDEIDEAESAIVRLPDAWPRFEHDTRRYLLRRFPFSVIYRVESRRVLILAVAPRMVALPAGVSHARDRDLARVRSKENSGPETQCGHSQRQGFCQGLPRENHGGA
jgi:plasmid stabilization system protein ParE